MAKIAALILPETRRDRLETMSRGMRRALSYAGPDVVDQEWFDAPGMCGSLLRVGPDPINHQPQPTGPDGASGVACGYYLRQGRERYSRETGQGAPGRSAVAEDPAARLIRDVAEYGVERLNGADGVFCFACWLPAERSLVCGVDALGVRPLFWARIPGGGYAVASEVKALLALIAEPEINWAAWEELLAFGDLFGDHTLFQGIQRLGPAGVLQLTPSEHRLFRREVLLESIEPRPRSVAAFMEENQATLDLAVRECLDLLPGDAAPYLTLSAGFDSRRLLGTLLAADARPEVYTVPIVQPDGTDSEAEVARALARRHELLCHVVWPEGPASEPDARRVRDLLTDFESGEHVWSTMLTLALGPRGAVNFDGFGGDVFVGGAYLKPGYFRDLEHFEAKYFHLEWDWLRLPSTDPPLGERLRNFVAPYREHPHWVSLFYFNSHSRRGTALAPTNVQGTSFESLFPYTHRSFVESGLSMSTDQLGPRNLQRESIGFWNPELAAFPAEGERSRLLEAGLVADYPAWRLRNRAAALRRTVRAARSGPGLTRRQAARLRLYSYLGRLLPVDFLRWQFHKITDAQRLARHLEISQSGDRYMKGADSLAGRFHGRPEWITRHPPGA
jgi:hypothetical protein